MTVLLGGVLGLAAAAPAEACTCGAIAVPSGASASSSGSRALIHWDGSNETIDLALDVSSTASPVAFVFPTPGRATVSAGDPSLFSALDAVTSPVQHREDDWWGRGTDSTATVHEDTSALPNASPVTATATVSAAGSRVAGWLSRHGVAISAAQSASLSHYVKEGWSISMIALDPSKAVDGRFAPIRFSFATPSLVLPFDLAATATGTTELTVAVLADTRTRLMQADHRSRNINAAESVDWAGPVSGTSLAGLGRYLTVTRVRLDDPATQVSGDIAIEPELANDSIMPSAVSYTPITLLGIPLGWLLVGWGVVGLVIGTGYLINRFRSQ